MLTKANQQTKDISHIYRGPEAPLTSIALGPSEPPGRNKGLDHSKGFVFASCWDKTIWCWNKDTRKQHHRFVGGHSDFVKCIICCKLTSHNDGSKKEKHSEPDLRDCVLLSGGADAKIVVWSAASGEKLHVLGGHVMGVLDLALNIHRSQEDFRNVKDEQIPFKPKPQNIEVFSAGSEREIRRWTIDCDSASTLPFDRNDDVAEPNTQTIFADHSALLVHETSVNRLHFPKYTSNPSLWTASSDRTAKQLIKGSDTASSKAYQPERTLCHPDYVRDVVVFPVRLAKDHVSEEYEFQDDEDVFAATACRDENIRVWNVSPEINKTNAQPVCILHGHFEEVTGLAVLWKQANDLDGFLSPVLTSVSIDGTVRRWPLDDDARERFETQYEKELSGEQDEENTTAAEDHDDPDELKKSNVKVTEEEERELEELMEEFEDDD